jgi:hypothetical protein
MSTRGGVGNPLYIYWSDLGVTRYVRAYDHEDAKRMIQKEHPEARFYR